MTPERRATPAVRPCSIVARRLLALAVMATAPACGGRTLEDSDPIVAACDDYAVASFAVAETCKPRVFLQSRAPLRRRQSVRARWQRELPLSGVGLVVGRRPTLTGRFAGGTRDAARPPSGAGRASRRVACRAGRPAPSSGAPTAPRMLDLLTKRPGLRMLHLHELTRSRVAVKTASLRLGTSR